MAPSEICAVFSVTSILLLRQLNPALFLFFLWSPPPRKPQPPPPAAGAATQPLPKSAPRCAVGAAMNLLLRRIPRPLLHAQPSPWLLYSFFSVLVKACVGLARRVLLLAAVDGAARHGAASGLLVVVTMLLLAQSTSAARHGTPLLAVMLVVLMRLLLFILPLHVQTLTGQ